MLHVLAPDKRRVEPGALLEAKQGGEPVCLDCLVVNGTSKLIINISSRYGC